MNICFFSAMYLPHTGGVERYTANMAEYLTRQGHHIIIVTSRQDSQLGTRYSQNNITIIQARSAWIVRERLPFLTRAGGKEITALLDQYPVDRIVIQTRLYPVSLFGMKYALERNIPFLTIDHGSDYVIHHGMLAPLEHLYERYLLRQAARLCHHWYTVSQSGQEWLHSLGVEPEGILYNFIDPEEVKAAHPGDILQIDHHFDPAKVNIVYCGRLIPEKGIRNLIQAVQYNNRELRQGPRQHLYIVGMGPLAEETAREAAKDPDISYLGGQPHANVLTLLHACSIFCLPSDYPEGLPTVVLEAALCGCYLIATDKGGTREVIRNKDYGTLLPTNDTTLLARAIQQAADIPEKRKSCIQNAHALVLQEFSISSTADRLMKVMQTLT